jgi:uncharacterized phage-associated protein
MACVHDVAAFIETELGKVGAMQLQKLVYYSQAWSIVWDEQPLFSEPVEAWEKGPVVGALRNRRVAGDPTKLSEIQRSTISAVLAFYGGRSGEWLSKLTHREPPWVEARTRAKGRQNPVITHDAMRAFFVHPRIDRARPGPDRRPAGAPGRRRVARRGSRGRGHGAVAGDRRG